MFLAPTAAHMAWWIEVDTSSSAFGRRQVRRRLPRAAGQLRVLVQANRRVIGESVAAAIQDAVDFPVIADSTDPRQGQKASAQPDVVVVVGSRIDGSTRAAVRTARRRWQQSLVVALAETDRVEDGIALVREGADTWLSRSDGLGDLRSILARIASGERLLLPADALGHSRRSDRTSLRPPGRRADPAQPARSDREDAIAIHRAAHRSANPDRAQTDDSHAHAAGADVAGPVAADPDAAVADPPDAVAPSASAPDADPPDADLAGIPDGEPGRDGRRLSGPECGVNPGPGNLLRVADPRAARRRVETDHVRRCDRLRWDLDRAWSRSIPAGVRRARSRRRDPDRRGGVRGAVASCRRCGLAAGRAALAGPRPDARPGTTRAVVETTSGTRHLRRDGARRD